MAGVTPRQNRDGEPEIGDWVLWPQSYGSLAAEVLGYDGMTGTWLLRADANGMIGWVRMGDFEWSGQHG